MKILAKEWIDLQTRKRAWASTEKLCIKFGNKYKIAPDILLSIFTIETFYRPLWMRIVEYCVIFFGCIRCLLLKMPMKNRTIGRCQLGISTILNFYGSDCYQHSHSIFISSISNMRQIFSVVSKERAIEILAYRLQPITRRAICIYPDLQENYIRYIGEQFNGRYSYGMLLSEIVSSINAKSRTV